MFYALTNVHATESWCLLQEYYDSETADYTIQLIDKQVNYHSIEYVLKNAEILAC